MPLMPKLVDRQAETVELMQRVTWYGPTAADALAAEGVGHIDLVGGANRRPSP